MAGTCTAESKTTAVRLFGNQHLVNDLFSCCCRSHLPAALLLLLLQVHEGLDLLRAQSCDFIIASGGGSSHTCANII
jgi:hypothetical protein